MKKGKILCLPFKLSFRPTQEVEEKVGKHYIKFNKFIVQEHKLVIFS